MTQQQKKLVTGVAVAVGVVALALAAFFVVGKGADRERGNMLTLAREYIDRGDYDRALDILDRLIIKNAADPEARALQDEALAKKAELAAAAAAAAAASAGGAAGATTDPALARTLGELGKSLERTATTVAQAAQSGSNNAAKTGQPAPAGQDPAAAAAEAARKAAAAEAAKKAEEEARAKAEAEAQAKAERDAAALAAKQREEELAKKGRELRERMEAINALVKSGRNAAEKGDYAKATQAFGDATGQLPQGEARFASQTWTDIAESWYDAYKNTTDAAAGVAAVKDAQRAAQEAIRSDATNAAPHYVLSKIYNDANLPDQALSELEQAQKLDPSNFLYAYELGKAYFRVKKFEEAKRAFESVTTKLNPKYEPAFFNLGMTYKALRNDNAALAAFRGALALKADYVRAHVEVGRILSTKGDLAGAVKAFTTALSFDAKDVGALRELGVAYVAGGKLKEAEQAFERALALSQDAATLYNLAKVKFDLQKYAEALPIARKAVELAPAQAAYQYQFALIAEKAGDIDAAILAYGKAAELDKRHVDSRVNLGRLYLESDFVDKALAVLEEAYRINPKSLEANNNLGNAYGKKSIFDKSVFHYEAALALAPRDVTIRLNLARAYVQAGEKEKSRDAYVEILKLDGNAWDAMYELGKLYVSMGDSANAKKTLAELVAKKPDYRARQEIDTILAGLR